MTMQHPVTGPRHIRRVDRQLQALDYRRQGMSHRAIAKKMNCSTSTAFAYVKDAIDQLPVESAQAVRTIELDKLDMLFMANLPGALRGDVPAGNLAIRQMELRLKLFGLLAAPVVDDADMVRTALADFMSGVQAASTLIGDGGTGS